MQLKLVVFALMLAYSCDNVLSHFTTSGNQLPLLACMRNMENIVQNVLCSQVGQYFTGKLGSGMLQSFDSGSELELPIYITPPTPTSVPMLLFIEYN